MDHHNPDDLDGELARLLAEHHAAEAYDVQLHIQSCACCTATARMIAGIRRDLWDLVEGRRP
jgi:hypothetical protein